MINVKNYTEFLCVPVFFDPFLITDFKDKGSGNLF